MLIVGILGVAAGGVAVSRAGGAGPIPEPTPDYREAVVSAAGAVVLDPLLAGSDAAARAVAELTSRSLLRIDDRAQVQPGLALSWGVSGNGLTYTFIVDGTNRFSTGRPVTAADAAASVAVVQSPGFPDAATAATWRGVVAHAVTADTLVLTLPTPRASFAASVAELPVLPAEQLGGGLAALLRTARRPMASSGPYVVTSAGPSSIRLAPSPHARQAPQMQRLELRLVRDFDAALRALAAGDVDAVEATTPAERTAVAAVQGVHLHDSVSFRFVDLILDTRRAGLDDPAVRRAIASTIDRRALIAGALGGAGRPQVSAIPAGIPWIETGLDEQPDPALAARALDAAGWRPAAPGAPRQKGALTLAFTLAVPDGGPLPAVGRLLAGQLGAVGIGIRVSPLSIADFMRTLRPAAFDLALADWDNGPDPDISSYWRSDAQRPNGFNVSGLAPDPFLDHALESLAASTDRRLRQDAATTVDQRLQAAVPAVFLYAPVETLAVTDAVQGVRVPPVGGALACRDTIATWRSAR